MVPQTQARAAQLLHRLHGAFRISKRIRRVSHERVAGPRSVARIHASPHGIMAGLRQRCAVHRVDLHVPHLCVGWEQAWEEASGGDGLLLSRIGRRPADWCQKRGHVHSRQVLHRLRERLVHRDNSSACCRDDVPDAARCAYCHVQLRLVCW